MSKPTGRPTGRPKTPITQRLETKIDFQDDGEGHWLWTGALNQDGYAEFQYATKDTRRAHRVLYELLVGPIPEGHHLDHIKELCQHRNCVKVIGMRGSPAHLEPVLPGENIRRGKTGQWQTERAKAKTKCAAGHDLAVHGYWRVHRGGKKGQWVCRECYRSYRRAWEKRKREEAKAAKAG